MRKIFAIGLFVLFIAAASLYPLYERRSQAEEQVEAVFDYDAWLAEREQVMEGKLSFDKEIPVLYVEELNLGGLDSRYDGSGVTELASFNEETKSLYLYSDEDLPHPDTTYLLLRKTYSMEVLLEDRIEPMQGVSHIRLQDIDATGGDAPNPVINQERLFLGTGLEVSLADNGVDMVVQWMDESTDGDGEQEERRFVLKPGDSEIIERKEGGLRSRLLFINYGPWSSKNVTYVLD